MSIVNTYEVIERVIIFEMIDLLRYDGEQDVNEWAEEREARFAALNAFVIATIGYNNPRLVAGIRAAISAAEANMAEHLANEWQIDDIERAIDDQAQKAVDFLNRNVNKAMISTEAQQGVIEETYRKIIDDVKEQQPDTPDKLKTVIGGVLIAVIGEGLYAGYKQSDGQQWRLDRYVNAVERHLYTDTYRNIAPETLIENGIELVRVHTFANPREACRTLQQSGIICIVPRSTASPEAQKYPNIHDAQHKYLQSGGHHGADGNCRHAWHSIDSTEDRSNKLYSALDVTLIKLLHKRMRLENAVNKRIGGEN